MRHFLTGLSSIRRLTTCQPVALSSNTFGDPRSVNSRPPLVIVHGLFGHKSNWNSIGKALHRRLDCVVYCVDMRNHGSSPRSTTMTYADMAADVGKFIQDRLQGSEHTKMNVLGHSMGGKIVMRLAVDSLSTGMIDHLIVEDVSPKGYSANHGTFRKYITAMQNVDLRRSRREILDALEPDIPELAIRQFLLTNLQSAANGDLEWKCNLDVISGYVEDVLGFSIPSSAFRGPTLFLYGADSGYVPDSDRPTIKCLFPRVEFLSIPNAGHWVHAEQPSLFLDGVCNFLEK